MYSSLTYLYAEAFPAFPRGLASSPEVAGLGVRGARRQGALGPEHPSTPYTPSPLHPLLVADMIPLFEPRPRGSSVHLRSSGWQAAVLPEPPWLGSASPPPPPLLQAGPLLCPTLLSSPHARPEGTSILAYTPLHPALSTSASPSESTGHLQVSHPTPPPLQLSPALFGFPSGLCSSALPLQ